jgi:predicted metalloprotease
MKWEGQRESENVEDARGSSGGGFGGLPIGGRGIGLGTVAIALVAGWIFGINPLTILGALDGSGGPPMVQQQQQQAPAARPPPEDKLARFVSTVLADTEDVWREQFARAGGTYRDPKLVLFRGAVPTACGQGASAMGPFYCPGDQKVYIDLDFYETMRTRLGAPGDFAQAYVIAHEVGHHVQNLMGITDKVDAMRGKVSREQANALSVRLELQADCLAGVWHHAQVGQILEPATWRRHSTPRQIGDDTCSARRGHGRARSFTMARVSARHLVQARAAKRQRPQCNTFDSALTPRTQHHVSPV